MSQIRFPKNFLWGASTSSHQVEGGCLNDWSIWEKENAERLAGDSASRYADCSPVWDEIKGEAQNPQNYISDRACEHYNRYKEDFNLAQSLGLKAYRFSIEWSRVEPKEGEFDEREIKHYQEMVRCMKERNLEPFVTLWHWTIPLWLKEKGGFANKKMSDYYSRYVKKIVSAIGQEVKFWITLNEPTVYTGQSYLVGRWPPQRKSYFLYYKVINNLIKAHKAAYLIIKQRNPQSEVGIASHNVYFEPRGFGNKLIVKILNYWWNFRFLDKIKNFQDFIGLNYYSHQLINYNLISIFKHAEKGRAELKETGTYLALKRGKKIAKTCNPLSDVGWELFPAGIYYTLCDLKKYHKPIYITEHGLADKNDKFRAWYLKESLKNVFFAIQKGLDVRGYFHWSLLDNFEWDSGFWPRFGLIEVDYKTQKRKIRPSAKEYAKIIKENTMA